MMRRFQWQSLFAVAAVTAACTFAPGAAWAQHADIEFNVLDGKIQLDVDGGAPVWTSDLLTPTFPPTTGPPPVQQDDPGFAADDGSFAPGGLVGMTGVQPLWYWDGVQLIDPPSETFFELEHPVTDEVVFVDASQPPAFGDMVIAPASEVGGIHQHIVFRLPDPLSPDGAYGVVAELNADSATLENSDPLLMVFNQRLPRDEFNAGVQAILEASGILNDDILRGDYNASGAVEQGDLDLVLLHWGQELIDPADVGWTADPPQGAIDQQELDNVLLNWGVSSEAPGISAVPEPESQMLFAIGLLVVLATSVILRSGSTSASPEAR